VIFRCV